VQCTVPELHYSKPAHVPHQQQQHSFNNLSTRTTWVERKRITDFSEAEMMGCQWHQLDHMQVIRTLLQTDNHASTSSLSFYKPDAFPATQLTASKH